MARSDQVLNEYLHQQDEASAEEVLAELLFRHAEPLARRVILRRLREGAAREHEDLTSEVLVDLIVRLRGCRQSPEEAPIENLASYIAVTAHHACDRYFRQLQPRRHQLKNRLRYVLRAEPRFALWADDRGLLLCGLSTWQGRSAVELLELPVVPNPQSLLQKVLDGIFSAAGGPVSVDDLTTLLANAWDIRDTPDTTVEERPAPSIDPAVALDNRRRLTYLWNCILALPVAQRTALLLHLRDERGGPLLPILVATGVATVRRLADVLEMPAGELAAIWNRLPLADTEIGLRLGRVRQQVINLRAAARQRLARMESSCAGDGNQ